MTIDEAIETNTELSEITFIRFSPQRITALKLGIEALKHIKSERTIYGFKRHFPLKGETED